MTVTFHKNSKETKFFLVWSGIGYLAYQRSINEESSSPYLGNLGKMKMI
jgi:hypothetical protein